MIVRATLVAAVGAVLVVVAVAFAASAAQAANEKTSPSEFVHRIADWTLNGQWDRMYDSLHPAEQRFVSRDRFLACSERRDQPAVDIVGWKTIDVFHVRTHVPGTTLRPWSTVVTVRITVRDPGSGQGGSFGKTSHLVLVGGHWRWMLTPADASAYKAGRCPAVRS